MKPNFLTPVFWMMAAGAALDTTSVVYGADSLRWKMAVGCPTHLGSYGFVPAPGFDDADSRQSTFGTAFARDGLHMQRVSHLAVQIRDLVAHQSYFRQLYMNRSDFPVHPRKVLEEYVRSRSHEVTDAMFGTAWLSLLRDEEPQASQALRVLRESAHVLDQLTKCLRYISSWRLEAMQTWGYSLDDKLVIMPAYELRRTAVEQTERLLQSHFPAEFSMTGPSEAVDWMRLTPRPGMAAVPTRAISYVRDAFLRLEFLGTPMNQALLFQLIAALDAWEASVTHR